MDFPIPQFKTYLKNHISLVNEFENVTLKGRTEKMKSVLDLYLFHVHVAFPRIPPLPEEVGTKFHSVTFS